MLMHIKCFRATRIAEVPRRLVRTTQLSSLIQKKRGFRVRIVLGKGSKTKELQVNANLRQGH